MAVLILVKKVLRTFRHIERRFIMACGDNGGCGGWAAFFGGGEKEKII